MSRQAHAHPMAFYQRGILARNLLNDAAQPARLWQQQRGCKPAASSSDNGSAVPADDQSYFATTPLYYVRIIIALSAFS